VSRVIQQISTPTLWLQDIKDTITPYDDMKHLKNLKLPHVEFVITDGLGHSLYRTDSIANKAVEFLAGIKTA
jgi:pimeloyl-ACP methyl ester carboxylesterase